MLALCAESCGAALPEVFRQLPGPRTAIQPVIIGESQRALAVSRALEDARVSRHRDSSAHGARGHRAAARHAVRSARRSAGGRADRGTCARRWLHEHAGSARRCFSLDRRAVLQAFDRASASYDAAAALQERVRNELIERLAELKVAPHAHPRSRRRHRAMRRAR